MTGEMFKAYTELILVPTLKRGDIVFMDNVSVHKVAGTKKPLRLAVQFRLPPSIQSRLKIQSSTYPPSSKNSCKVAAYTLKNAAFTVRSLCKTIASCLDQVSRAECAAYLGKLRIWST
jgi:hypothetical protein